MNKKIKIVEILNKIANGEQPPKRIKSENKVFYFKEDETSIDYLYRVDETGNGWLVVQDLALNDEVEILEDNTEEIETIDDIIHLDSFVEVENDLTEVRKKINQLVKAVNKLKKGEKGEC